MVAEAKISALQSDLDEKEDERKLYNDKFKQYGRENRELKKELAEIEANRMPETSKSKKTAKTKVISNAFKSTGTASTSQSPVSRTQVKPTSSISNGSIKSSIAASNKVSLEPSPRKKLCQRFAPKTQMEWRDNSDTDDEDDPPSLAPISGNGLKLFKAKLIKNARYKNPG